MKIEDLDYAELIKKNVLGGIALAKAQTSASRYGVTANSDAVATGSYTFSTTDTYTFVYNDSDVSGGNAGASGGAITVNRLKGSFRVKSSASVDASVYVSLKH